MPGRAKHDRVIDPLLGHVDLLAPLGLVGLAEVAADGGPGDVQAMRRTAALDLVEEWAVGGREVVGGELDAVEVKLAACPDEVLKAPLTVLQ